LRFQYNDNKIYECQICQSSNACSYNTLLWSDKRFCSNCLRDFVTEFSDICFPNGDDIIIQQNTLTAKISGHVFKDSNNHLCLIPNNLKHISLFSDKKEDGKLLKLNYPFDIIVYLQHLITGNLYYLNNMIGEYGDKYHYIKKHKNEISDIITEIKNLKTFNII
jgi:hypothetical protein